MTSIKLKHILIVCGASSLLMIYMFLGVQRSRSSLVLAAREDVVDSLQSYARGDNLSKQPVKVKRTVDKGRQATVARLHSLTDSWASVSSEDLPQCKDFLNSVKHGRWVHRKPPLEQNLRDLNHQISDLRTKVLGIPATLQREDLLCGNVSYPGTKLRALCHPEGDTPCCAADNTCVARSMDQCRCQTCWDLRRDFHADLAEFLPRDVSCHVGRYTDVEQVCTALDNVTLMLVGDSLVAQIYVSLLALLAGGGDVNSLQSYLPPGQRSRCRGQRVYEVTCRRWLDHPPVLAECGSNAILEQMLVYQLDTRARDNILHTVRFLRQRPRSVLLVGVGVHEDFNTTHITDTLIRPLMEVKGASPWPYVIWLSPHTWGQLHLPGSRRQSREAAVRFTHEMTAVLEAYSVPVLDTGAMTEQVVSYDGMHFGQGVNHVKARVVLEMVKRLKHNSWTSI